MEDDIDIEEHDVLDNPKIRDIFPDLSLVKIEVPDEEYQDPYEQSQHESPPQLDYQELSIKRERLSDDIQIDFEQIDESENIHLQYEENDTDGNFDRPTAIQPNEQNSSENEQNSSEIEQNSSENEQNSSEIEQNSNEIEQNKQILSREIIASSKPIPDYDTLYEEALKSNVTVNLENWDARLKNSLCYCDDCEILFPTINAFDAHKSVTHSFLVALDTSNSTARKSTVTTSSTYCNHCDKTFRNDTALITHLYELLPLNDFQKSSHRSQPVNPLGLFKCDKCNRSFATLPDLRRHITMVHNPSTSLIPKIESTKQDKGKFFASTSLIPKSVLFQCHKCQVNFLSCFAASCHTNMCDLFRKFDTCDICKRKIRTKDSKLHKLQHTFAEKIIIYTVHKSMYERVLIKCPNCSICYDEKLFWCHLKDKVCFNEHTNYAHCNICNIDISKIRSDNHRGKHFAQRYTKKDFIVVEYVDISTTRKVKQTVQTMNTIEKGVTLYYCDDCGACKKIFTQRGHLNGLCVNGVIKYCDVCGLGFTKNNVEEHRELHVKRNLTLSDFKIVSLKSGKEIEPPIPTFPSCGRCKMHFLNRQTLNIHKCDTTPFKICAYCDKKFDLNAIEPHSNFHTYKDIPELLKKYNSINNMWNVVYLCAACELVTLSYDTAVSHSQDHINDVECPQTKNCEICDFDIIEKDHWNHMIIHESNENINREGFEILKFHYNHLFKKQWMDLFAKLPKPHKYQILMKSIYRCSRRVKFNIEVDARTKEYKFYCKKCKIQIQIEDVKSHHFEGTCKYSAKYICNICHLKFSTITDCVSHEKDHDILAKTYKIITFNDPKDEQFDQRLKDFELPTPVKTKAQKLEPKVVKSLLLEALTSKSVRSSSVSSKSSVKSGSVSSKSVKSSKLKPIIKIKLKNSFRQRHGGVNVFDKTNRIKLYKCEKCRSCITYKRNLQAHKCIAPENRRLCKSCKEYFNASHINTHIQLHSRLPKLAKKKPLIVYFNPTKHLSEAIIFQCECGLHFTSKQSIDKHITVCDETPEISKEMCSKCNLLFPTDVLVSHLCKHHSKNVDIKVKIVKKTIKNKFFKCCDCSVVYDNMADFDTHIFYCGSNKSRQECPECNVFIDQKLNSHKCVAEDGISVLNNTAVTITLWKCERCEICYLNKESHGYHIKVNHVVQTDIINCEICSLKFTTTSYKKHLDHHLGSSGYIIKVIDAETMDFIIIKDDKFKYDVINVEDKAVSNKKLNIVEDNSSIRTNSPLAREFDKSVDSTDVEAQIEILNIFRCASCNLCFTSRKAYHYHIKVNHVNHMATYSCEICDLKFTTAGIKTHLNSHRNSSYMFQVINPETLESEVVKTKNFKVDVKNWKINVRKNKMLKFEPDSDSNSARYPTPKKKLKMDDDNSSNRTNSPVAKYKYEQSFDEEFVVKSKSPDVDKQIQNRGYLKIYRCSSCDICFTYKRRYRYHVQSANHVIRRPVLPCDTCGLRFTTISLRLHKPFHELGESYAIKVIELDSNQTETLRGKNKQIQEEKTKKRSARSAYNSRSKRAKIDTEPKPSTSKDYESIDMDDEKTADSIFEDIDPLNTFETILPDEDTDIENNKTKNDGIKKEDINRYLSAERKAKIRAHADNYTKTLYKCLTCKLHFMNCSSLNSHIKRKKHDQIPCKCNDCGLDFTERTLGTHIYLHHTKLQLTLEQFDLETFCDADAKILVRIDHSTIHLDDVIANNEENTLNNDENVLDNDENALDNDENALDNDENALDNDENTVDNDENTLDNDENTLDNDENKLDNDENTVDNEDILDNDENTLDITANTNDNLKNTLDNAKIHYYLCADCNVCFIEESNCRNHCISHEVLDSKEYIECKICNFQFLIDYLKEHVNIHHNDEFSLNDVVITEFKANDKSTKIDTYRAVDKVQSKLVSTTTDVLNEHFEAEDIIGI